MRSIWSSTPHVSFVCACDSLTFLADYIRYTITSGGIIRTWSRLFNSESECLWIVFWSKHDYKRGFILRISQSDYAQYAFENSGCHQLVHDSYHEVRRNAGRSGGTAATIYISLRSSRQNDWRETKNKFTVCSDDRGSWNCELDRNCIVMPRARGPTVIYTGL